MSTSERLPWQTRRLFLLQVLAAAAAAGCGDGGTGSGEDASSGGGTTGGGTTGGGMPTTGEGETTTGGPVLGDDPFTLGIASGDPLADSVILWTRLAVDPGVGDGGMPDEDVEVVWEIADDEAFTQGLVTGTVVATPTFAHSVHVDVGGLAADTWYFYRFKVGAWTSPVGRTRTTPTADAKPAGLKFATACCQSYVDGYYTTYAHLATQDIDVLLFLGDYIYENGATGPVRSHVHKEPTTLAEYRVRYGLYKSDENLQAAHARCPWAMIWDDHEVENNYVGDISQDDAPTAEWLVRRAAAYQAYYEHMPLRLPPPAGPDFQIYRTLKWGDLADFWLLDTRQYRDDQNCGGVAGMGCDGWESYDGTVLGDEQEAWLKEGLLASTAVWKILAQQIVMATTSFGGSLVNWDQWDGYPVARQRLLDFLADSKLKDVVVLSGDIHLGAFGDLGALAEDDASPVVAAEIVTTSISSDGEIPAETAEALLAQLPRLKYLNAVSRGHVLHDVTRTLYTARAFVVDTALEAVSAGKIEAEFYIDAGTPGFRPKP